MGRTRHSSDPIPRFTARSCPLRYVIDVGNDESAKTENLRSSTLNVELEPCQRQEIAYRDPRGVRWS